MPDLKVYVKADPDAAPPKPRFFSAAEVDRLQTELSAARAAVEAEQRRGKEALAAQQEQYPTQLQFVYASPKYMKPFYVRAIWHDGQFTYLQTDAKELPALYELKDGKAGRRQLPGPQRDLRRAEGHRPRLPGARRRPLPFSQQGR